MTRRPLTSERALRRREQLLEIALGQLLARDYEDVSVDEIADLAGVSHGLVFQYFGSKKDLYIASLEPLLSGFQERSRSAPADLPPRERLRHAIASYYDDAIAHPAGYRSLMAGGGGFREVFDRIEAQRWDGIGLIAETVGLDVERADVRAVLRGWVGWLEGAILASLERPDADREALVESALAVFAAGLVTLGPDPSRA
ncbi:MAG: TetR/AcrR family transcriptional regulator [Solirubrobacterales bacterium]|nr:TetR/AcrR family transcriptional regulator [Solirubrobacterales bacterium]